MADESDGPDGWCDLDQSEINEEMDSKSTLSSSNRESLGKYNDLLFYNYYVKTRDIVIHTVCDRKTLMYYGHSTFSHTNCIIIMDACTDIAIKMCTNVI